MDYLKVGRAFINDFKSYKCFHLVKTKDGNILKIADLVRDAAIIAQVQQSAYQIWQQYPNNAVALINRWLGNKEKYSNA